MIQGTMDFYGVRKVSTPVIYRYMDFKVPVLNEGMTITGRMILN